MRCSFCSPLSPLRKEGLAPVPRSIRPLLAICAALLIAPAAAQAQTPAPTGIDGSPLNIWASGDGSIQANVDGYTRSEWFPYVTFDPETGNEIPTQVGNVGFGLILDPENTSGNSPRFGKFISGALPTPTSGPTLTTGNPVSTITTTWTLPDTSSGAPAQVELTQVLSYSNGSRQFDSTFSVKNVSGNRLAFRANVAGDLAIRGSDSGIGFLTGTPGNRFMGGLNQEVGAAGGFVEQTPWTHFQSDSLGTVGGQAGDATPTGGFQDFLSTEPSDNAAGVQWDDHYSTPLDPGATAEYRLGWKYIDTLGLTPPTASKLTGEEASLVATVGTLQGTNAGDKTLDYTVVGANNLSGKLKTGADGRATINYVGGAPGDDFVTVFDDSNANGTRDTNEAQATATIHWDGPPAPAIGVSAGVRPVKGTVKIKLPPGTSAGKAKRLGLSSAAASSFVKLTEATQIPMGSTLDTSKGTVNLLAAASKNSFQGKFQSGNFNGGQFKVTQSSKNPLTTLSMGGGKLKACPQRVPKGGSAARKRSRRLFSNVKGRFRTRGRNSSATVRGTKYSMTDTCKGTLTAVSKGVVVVRDFTLKKNKTVKAGHRYFARAPKLRRVSK
jgi:hypothetical protein